MQCKLFVVMRVWQFKTALLQKVSNIMEDNCIKSRICCQSINPIQTIKNENAVKNGLHIHAYQNMRFDERYENNATCKLVNYTMNNDHGVVNRASVNRQKIGSAYIHLLVKMLFNRTAFLLWCTINDGQLWLALRQFTSALQLLI